MPSGSFLMRSNASPCRGGDFLFLLAKERRTGPRRRGWGVDGRGAPQYSSIAKTAHGWLCRRCRFSIHDALAYDHLPGGIAIA
eukprot:6596710-Pyramimonas_sp.AAC.1